MDIEQLAGTKLGNYEIESLLGRGGMGVVYKARQISLDRIVALKILPPSLGSDSSFVKRFMREAHAVAKLDHSNIVQIHDITEEQGFHFFSMQYVKGNTLEALLKKKKRLNVDEAIRIIVQVALAIEHAHENKIIHRDIKPSNIILDDSGNVKVTDFGLAKAADDRSKVTKSGALIGTLGYMSPEQCRGEKLGFNTDIYSLGVVLYEMLTGQEPFHGDSAPDLIHKIIYEEPTDAGSLNPEISPGLTMVIHRAMAKDKDKRYANISELLRDLQDLEGHTPATTIERQELSPSIAVLPFINMSADPEQEYFCDGLSEELINALTQMGDLHVIARTSAFSFKNKDVDIYEIGRKLKVATILEGSVRKAGNRIRITAQLVDTESGHHLWSERYDRELDDVFAIQDEITSAIVERLSPKLIAGEEPGYIKHRIVDPEAYILYFKGRWFWDKLTQKGILKAIKLFESAIEKDPGYAPAFAALAHSYCTLPLTSSFSPKQVYPKAKKAALKAIELDDTLADAHASLAHIMVHYDWDWHAAEEEYRRAIELNPGCAMAHYVYSSFLKYMGRYEESLREITHALELDPLSLQKNALAALAYCYNSKTDKAIEIAQKTIKMDPSYSYAHVVLGYIYFRELMIDESLAEFKKCRNLSKTEILPGTECAIGIIAALKGNTDEARQILDSFIQRADEHYFSPYYIAAMHFVLGRVDDGFSWLEKAYEERDYFLVNLKTERIFDALGVNSDPRFISMLSRMNFPT
jgi:serine/threonine-protein kinase